MSSEWGFLTSRLIDEFNLQPVLIVVTDILLWIWSSCLLRSVISLAPGCISFIAQTIFIFQRSLIGWSSIGLDWKCEWHRTKGNEGHWRRISMFCFYHCSDLTVGSALFLANRIRSWRNRMNSRWNVLEGESATFLLPKKCILHRTYLWGISLT